MQLRCAPLYKEKHKVIQNVNFWFIFLVWGNFSQLFLKTRVKATSNTFSFSSFPNIKTALFASNAISGTFRNIFDGGWPMDVSLNVLKPAKIISDNSEFPYLLKYSCEGECGLCELCGAATKDVPECSTYCVAGKQACIDTCNAGKAKCIACGIL